MRDNGEVVEMVLRKIRRVRLEDEKEFGENVRKWVEMWGRVFWLD